MTEEASQPGTPRHAAPDGAGPHPLIDLSRDPTPGVPDHAAPEPDEQDQPGQPGQQAKPGAGA